MRLSAENDRLHEECALLCEELRLKDARIAQISPQWRPHYGPYERMAILEFRAARGVVTDYAFSIASTRRAAMRRTFMALVTWDDNFKVNVQEIGSQHEAFFDLLNQLYQAMKLRHDRETLGGLLSELVEYTRKHFSYEESLLSDYEYPEHAKHKAEHEKLMQHVGDLERRIRGGDLLLSFAIVLELKGWATNHFEDSDKRLGAFLNGKSVF